jgi:uroporphyrinogen decarboxylase
LLGTPDLEALERYDGDSDGFGFNQRICWGKNMGLPMTSRERVLSALEHEEPDRVPIFFGTSGATSMLASAYDRLKAHLGVTGETTVFWRALQYALLDEEVMLRFGSDGRVLLPGPAPSANERELSSDAFVDGWGIPWKRKPGSHYFEIGEPPLRNAGIEDIALHPWPDLCHPSRFKDLKTRAHEIQQAGYAVVALSGVSPFEYSYMLRGVDNWLVDLALNPEFADALMRKVSDLQGQAMVKLLEAAGAHIDVVVIGDDLATQNTLMISPEMYRKQVKPYQAELISAIKRKTKAKVFYHSCGNIYPLINDLIEIGVDLLNPIQVSTKDMHDTARLKREFGKRLSFCGAIDTQKVLPYGNVDDVRREVRRRVADLGPGGGYILSAVHCIQPDVPPENVCAMFEEALAVGRYPLNRDLKS